MSRGGTSDAAVGMMDGAYFTGRKEIIEFFNELLDLNLSKIEQTASGAVACQLLEYIFPGSVQMKRVNWEAKSSYEFIQNYKLLQAAFSKNRIQKYIDVDKLIRAKYQDNLEFCQWLKAFYDQSAPPYRDNYDPVAVRAKGKGSRNADPCFNCTGQNKAAPSAPAPRPATRQRNVAPTRKPVTSTARSRETSPKPPSMGSGAVRTTQGRQPQRQAQRQAQRQPQRRQNVEDSADDEAAVVADASLMKKNSELMARNAELELTMSTIEKERDFYFEKLRGIEIMLQVHDEKSGENGSGVDSVETDALIKRIFRVLYATSDDEVVVDDNGELIEGEIEGDGSDQERILLDEHEEEDGLQDSIGNEFHDELHEDIIGGDDDLHEDLLTEDLDVHSYDD
uniref:EB1 C-terminal domain-containing protein n=4 Tax=Ditylum brightwellii TaxID=49249 RepID=A0A6S8RIV5_9STRA|mmetsp:Transcript_10731/g.14401  ORF Transcript_10731/g.14401 Transcript_10731/m.14401 type:complete len:395 (+) Transcript_10731:39-1223(+)